ncbi:hypothetical protein OG851_39095 [Streptomyces sp. NBC_00161]|uniref:hypothetical protein n=1 Tax=Streptomyces sp. NBC_00161 TaxID=2975671 RepID=UPI003255FC8B
MRGAERLALPCAREATAVELRRADVRVKELYRWDTPNQGLFVRQTPAPKGSVVVLVGRADQQISVPAVKEAANRHLGVAVPVETIAGSWLNAANMDDRTIYDEPSVTAPRPSRGTEPPQHELTRP